MIRWRNIWIFYLGLSFLFTLDHLTERKTDVGYFSKFNPSKTLPEISMCVPLKTEVKKNLFSTNCENQSQPDNNPYVLLICFVSNLTKQNKSLIPSEIIKYARSIHIHKMFNITMIDYDFKKASIYMINFHLCMTYKLYMNSTVATDTVEEVEQSVENEQQIESIDNKSRNILSSSSYERERRIATLKNEYRVEAKLFVFPPDQVDYLFSINKFYQHCSSKSSNSSTSPIPQCNAGQIMVTRANYRKLKAPYKTDCFNYTDAKFNFTRNHVYSRVSCLSECRKSLFTDQYFLYTEMDNVPLNRKLDTKYDEYYCLFKCNKSDCLHSFYYTASWRNLSTFEPLIQILFDDFDYDIVTYGVKTQITHLLEVASYLCLIYNNNLIVQIVKIYRELAVWLVKYKFSKKLGRLLKKEFVFVRIYALAVVIAAIMFSSVLRIVIEQFNEEYALSYFAYIQYPVNYTHIVVNVCFPLVKILKNQESFYKTFPTYTTSGRMSEHDLLNLNDQLLNNYTINKLNQITKNETDLIHAKFVYNNLITRDLESNVSISFQPTYLHLEQDGRLMKIILYAKCFGYSVNKIEYQIQRLYRMSQVSFDMLNDNLFSHFVITERNQYPNYKDNKLFASCDLHRITTNSYEGGGVCKQYKTAEDGCSRRDQCIENCIKQQYAKKFKKIPFMVTYRLNETIKDGDGSAIERIDSFTEQRPQFKQTEENCSTPYSLNDCETNFYFNPYYCTEEKFTFKSINLKLYLTNLIVYDVRLASFETLINQISTILTVVFGFSIPATFRFIYKCTNLIFKINLNLKRLRPAIRTLLFLVMCLHFHSTLLRAIENNPLPNTLYKPFFDFKLPRVTTCVEYDYKHILNELKRKNETLTGRLLNERTSNISIENLYDKIMYYTRNLTEQTISGKEMVEKDEDKPDEDISYEVFFFQKYKCFNIELGITYDTNNPKLFYIDDMIRLYVGNDAPIGQMFYSLSPPNTINFNQLNRFFESCLHLNIFESYYATYKDSFKYIRNPKLIFFKGYQVNNEEDYLNFLTEKTADIKLTALFLPIFKKHFDLPIDDNKLFALYKTVYAPMIEISDVVDPDCERKIYKSINMYKRVAYRNMTMLIVNPNFLYFQLSYSNRENPSTILLYLLNVISIWLDINVVDYPKIIIRLANKILELFKLLIFKLKLVFSTIDQ